MGESVGIDSFFGVGAMPKAYSANIRGRVIARIEGRRYATRGGGTLRGQCQYRSNG